MSALFSKSICVIRYHVIVYVYMKKKFFFCFSLFSSSFFFLFFVIKKDVEAFECLSEVALRICLDLCYSSMLLELSLSLVIGFLGCTLLGTACC